MDLPQEEYKYEPLPPQTQDAIRLLTINPAEKDAPLTGHFSVASMQDSPSYEALSYVWGDPERPEFLYTPEGYIRITRSLHAALKRIRQYEPPDGGNEKPMVETTEPPRRTHATVWADAVCINQEDNTEKAHQVRLMGKIFSSAIMVWAYLGEDENDKDEVLSCLRIISSPIQSGEPTYQILRRLASERHSIFNRDYFSRVWIIQEFILAKRVVFICGSLYFDSGILVRLANSHFQGSRQILESQPLLANQASKLFHLRSGYIEKGPRWPLVRILSHFRGHTCTRARDHLFALLSLAYDASSPGLDPNYDDPIEQIVRRYAEVFIKNGCLMELLSLAGHDPDPAACLPFPSWIPNWTSDLPAVAECVAINHDWCQIANDQTSCKTVGNILQLKGRLIDEVSDIQNAWSPGISAGTLVRHSSLEKYAEAFGSLFDDICKVSGILPCSINSRPPFPQKYRLHQVSVNSSISSTTATNPGLSLMDLVQSLPASAPLEQLRTSFRPEGPNDEWFAWLATCFAKYRSWRANRISIGLSPSLGGDPLPNEHEDRQKDAYDSSESDSDADDPSAYDTYLKDICMWKSNRFVTWANKKLNHLTTKEEKYQFVEELSASEYEASDFRGVEWVFKKAHPLLILLLHTFRVWKVFKTKSGRTGIGPLRTRIGDRLYITKMSKKPIVLRKIEGEEGLYQFVAVAEMSSMEFEDDDDLNEVLRIR